MEARKPHRLEEKGWNSHQAVDDYREVGLRGDQELDFDLG